MLNTFLVVDIIIMRRCLLCSEKFKIWFPNSAERSFQVPKTTRRCCCGLNKTRLWRLQGMILLRGRDNWAELRLQLGYRVVKSLTGNKTLIVCPQLSRIHYLMALNVSVKKNCWDTKSHMMSSAEKAKRYWTWVGQLWFVRPGFEASLY